jgi:hypothetical protein
MQHVCLFAPFIGKDGDMASMFVRTRDTVLAALLPAAEAHAQTVCKGCQRYSYECGVDFILGQWVWSCMWVEAGRCSIPGC